MTLKGPEAYELLADETRRKILYLLRVKEMNVTQIAEQLGVTSQAIYHHMKKLVKGNMVEITREERRGHLLEAYYRATAEEFLLSHGNLDPKNLRDRENLEAQVKAILKVLNDVCGLDLGFNKDDVSEIVDMEIALDHSWKFPEDVEKQIWANEDLDVFSKVMATRLVKTILIPENLFEKEFTIRKHIREKVLSLSKKNKQKLKVAQISKR